MAGAAHGVTQSMILSITTRRSTRLWAWRAARREFGGVKGRMLGVKAGDVVILPAGTGHRLIEASRNFLVVGAYPEDGTYDECTDTRERPDAIKRVAKVRKPANDPIYGHAGPLALEWRGRGEKR
jgi:uncharacterized protein YjlB